MTIPTIYLFFIMVGIFSVAIFTACVSIPRDLRSLYRYKMWKLRDDVFDDIASGRLSDNQVSNELLVGIEMAVQAAPWMTLLNWLSFPKVPDDESHRRIEFLVLAKNAMSSDERELFEKRQKEFHKIFVRHLVCGSLSGWFVIAITIPVFFAICTPKALRRGAMMLALEGLGERRIAMTDRVWMFKDSEKFAAGPLPFCSA